jgi:nucleotide-binding universal stress UspA family protein
MYKKILVAVENSEADRVILDHARQLARLMGASLLVVHVADGWAARHFDDLNLRESEEMRQDRGYLEQLSEELRAGGIDVEARLALGDPASALVRVAEQEKVDLIAMSTHGHRFIKDVILGTTVDRVRHVVKVPVLLLRAK